MDFETLVKHISTIHIKIYQMVIDAIAFKLNTKLIK